MKKLILAVLIVLALPSVAAAHGGHPTPPDTQITYTTAQTTSFPFVFEPIDFSGSTGPELGITIVDVDFINYVGSIALTVYGILGVQGIFGIAMVLMLAVGVVFWVWSLVSETPRTVSLNVSGAVDTGVEVYGQYLTAQESADLAALPAGDAGGRQNIKQLYSGRRQVATGFQKITRNAKRLGRLR